MVCLLFAQAVALSPELHRWIHCETRGPAHECAAVLLALGALEPAPGAADLPLPPLLIRGAQPPTHAAWTDFPFLLPPGRGPPVG